MKTKRARSKRVAAGALRKLTPRALPPTPRVLESFTLAERNVLTKRLGEVYECIYDVEFRKELMSADEARALAAARDVESMLGAPLTDKRNITMVLTAAQEGELFTKFNYARCRVMRLMKAFAGQRLTRAAARALLRWDAAADAIRAEIVKANTSLVLAMARRARGSGADPSELIAEGNLALVRCVDKFDCKRGFKFSTYACRAILAGFARSGSKSARYRQRFPSAYDPAMERSDFAERKREAVEVECLDELKQILKRNTADLSGVEQSVLQARFALNVEVPDAGQPKGRTLEEVGMLLGVSKERVRQIQNQAFRKIRSALEGQYLAAS